VVYVAAGSGVTEIGSELRKVSIYMNISRTRNSR